MGVTASGKGSLGFEMARTLGGELLSIDSMKVYRRMDIGTAKPPLQKRKQIPWHLIDVVEPSESFSVDRFLDLAHQEIQHITNAGKSVVGVGGTAMYIKAILYGLFKAPPSDPAIREQLKERIQSEGLITLHQELEKIDPEAAARIHSNDERRIVRALEVWKQTGRPISKLQKQWDLSIPDNWILIGLRREKTVESGRINARVKRMIEQGWFEEARRLLAEPKPLSKQARAAIGYAEIMDHLEGKIGIEEAVEKIKINTRRLAKAQRTWFKTFQGVQWLDIKEEDTLEKVTDRALNLVTEKC